VKTPFERATLGSLTEVDVKSQEKRFTVTLIRPCHAEEISMEMIPAPDLSAAFIQARHFFPGARILSVVAVPDPLPVRAAKDTNLTPGARFIRGLFRPALFNDEGDLRNLID